MSSNSDSKLPAHTSRIVIGFSFSEIIVFSLLDHSKVTVLENSKLKILLVREKTEVVFVFFFCFFLQSVRLVCEVEEVRDEYKWGSEDGAEKERERERE